MRWHWSMGGFFVVGPFSVLPSWVLSMSSTWKCAPPYSIVTGIQKLRWWIEGGIFLLYFSFVAIKKRTLHEFAVTRVEIILVAQVAFQAWIFHFQRRKRRRSVRHAQLRHFRQLRFLPRLSPLTHGPRINGCARHILCDKQCKSPAWKMPSFTVSWIDGKVSRIGGKAATKLFIWLNSFHHFLSFQKIAMMIFCMRYTQSKFSVVKKNTQTLDIIIRKHTSI